MPPDLVSMAQPGDQISPLAHDLLAKHSDADIIYGDDDELDRSGQRCRPRFKPDWSPEWFEHVDYIGSACFIRRCLFESVAAEYGRESVLHHAVTQARKIVHIHEILVHRQPAVPKAIPAASTEQKSQHHPLVSIVIPNRDQAALLEVCLQSVRATTDGPIEIIIVENGSRDPATHDLYHRWRATGLVQVLEWEHRFNYSAVNNFAAARSHGEFLLFLNNDIEAIRPGWLPEMVRFAARPGVGAVGAKLLYPDQTIQHAGVVLGMHGVAGHLHRGEAGDFPGHMARLKVPHNVAAVTGACLLVRAKTFHQVGGFNEDLELAYNDIDLCLNLLSAGFRNVLTPWAELIHHESKTRGLDDTAPRRRRLRGEVERLRAGWPTLFTQGDPYFSPHFRLDRTDCCLG